jgi:hypothetical protein
VKAKTHNRKSKNSFSDGEMNDRFTDMGFSQGHQSCGGEPDISIWKIGETLS